jgi:3-hydroxyisobutyrate dehydrogenase
MSGQGEDTALQIGYVGLGVMGGALARRLLLTHPLRVFDLRAEAVAALVAEGCDAAPSPAALARACDIVFTCLPTSVDLHQAVFGADGLAEGLAHGTIVVDQTTGDPTDTRRLAAKLAPRGVALVDAPVSGGPRGAVAGTIAIMCGGPEVALARVRPILEIISPNIVHCGASGNGHAAKLLNNAVAACNRLITYEAAALGCKYGLAPADMARVINVSTGWNGASERILPVLGTPARTADFRLSLMVKDLQLAARMAMECGAPMLVANTVRTLFEVGANQLGGNGQLDDMARLFEAMARLRFDGSATQAGQEEPGR